MSSAINFSHVGNIGGPNITDWSPSLTFTPNSFGTVTGSNIWSRRVGDTLQVRGEFAYGTATAAPGSISLPSGYAIDSSKLTATASAQHVGTAFNLLSTTNSYASGFGLDIFYDGSDTAKVYLGYQVTAGAFSKDNASVYATSSGKIISFEFSVPILGWIANGAGTSANVPRSQITYDGNNGFGSTNTQVRRFINARVTTGTDCTYADSATLGGSVTINSAGVWSIQFHDMSTAGAGNLGIVINGTAQTTNVRTITYAQGLRALGFITTATTSQSVSWTGILAVNDVITFNSNSTDNTGSGAQCMFTVTKVSN